MASVLWGVFVGVCVFLMLLVGFAGGTGPIELVLWAVLGVASGALVTTLLRLGSRPKS